MKPRLFIAIPAYNAAKTIASVFDRMPAEIDDGSKDDTAAVVRGLMTSRPKIQLIEHPVNRGYGGACKTGLSACRDGGAELIGWVHADGQYAPEELPRLLAPLAAGKADMVQGSRMRGGGALAGGMPVYKYIANKMLSLVENIAFGMRLAEFHSGYMCYHRRALERIPFETFNTRNFIFDQEMMVVGKCAGLRLIDISIPTRYGDEESHLKVIPYGFAVLGMIGRYFRGDYDALRPSTPAAR
jgi:glycosyltransferase involved in cell wall biosynthesis